MINLELMRKRLEWHGGVKQEDRMIKDKWRSFQRSLQYSYQACSVQLAQRFSEVIDLNPDQIDPEMSIYPVVRALINPDKVKQDYDDKILSIDYGHQFQPGDVFEWKKTGTHWIIYTQEITEDAYFRGEIRRCRYQIKFKDEEGNQCATWAAIRGPVETQINSIQKNQMRIDTPNLSLNILMPRNEKTLAAFERYKKFIFEGRAWRVEAPDSISMKNVLEINAEENYMNEHLDDEFIDELVIEPIDPTPQSEIKGETFIKPKIEETYQVEETGGKWSILDNAPVILCPSSNKSATVIWDKMVSGEFTLRWEKDGKVLEKVIVVESLY